MVSTACVALLEEQPAGRFARLGLQAHQHPATLELFAPQPELEVAAFEPLVDVAHRGPGAGVPDDHRAAAIFAGGDHALEIE